jgi:hypothetical protein
MKAGAALGLLAGLGALNAIRGGREGTGKRFTGLMDMLDGGGAGASGDKFEGGGLLSILGNLFAKPLEAQDNVERIAARTSARTSSPKPVLRPTMTTGTPITEYSESLLPPTLPVTSDPRNFQRGTEPSTLTDAQKEAIVMGQAVPAAEFDPRNFQRGTEPSTLTENQRMRAAGILAGQAAMEPVTQDQLQGGSEIEAPAALGISTMGSYKTPEPPKTPDPMGLLPRQTMVPPSATNMDAPSVGALLDVPSAPPSEAQTMLQSLSATIPLRAMENDPLIVQDYKDYVISGGRDDYSTYYKSRPEYQAERQLFTETGGTLFDLSDPERKRLIAERADILRRETPKPAPFTGPAF